MSYAIPLLDSNFVFDIFTGEQHATNNIWGFFRTVCQATDWLFIGFVAWILLGRRKVELIARAFAAMELKLDIIQPSESQSSLLQNLQYFKK